MAGNILVPMDMDAFCLTADLADGTKHTSRICPVTQPDYTGLRLQDAILQHDILDHVDLHKSQPAEFNPRLADLGSWDPVAGKHLLRDNRIGTYVHWSLPRYYRAGRQSTDSYVPPVDGTSNTAPTSSSPNFPLVPNRWLIIRHLQSFKVPAGHSEINVPADEGWVVESDRLWNIDELPDTLGYADFAKGIRAATGDVGLEPFDLECDVSPLVDPSASLTAHDTIDVQAEKFIGMRTSVDSWSEQNPPAPSVQLTTMTSSNPLFADYTFHNSNVFSIRDNFMYSGKDGSGNDIPVYLEEAVANYSVIGWHSRAQDDPFTAPTGGAFKENLQTRLQELFMTLKWDSDPNIARTQQNDKSNARLLCHSSIYNVHFRRSGSPETVTADVVGKNFHADVLMEPLSVGTTPLDALLTYLDAHADDPAGDLTTLSSAIRKLAGLLIAADDSYDSQVKAQDLLYGNNFAEADGGSEWHYDGRAEAGLGPPIPSPTEIQDLSDLNDAQSILDATNRELELKRWSLFAEWWNLVSDSMAKLENPNDKQKYYKPRIDALVSYINNLITRQKNNEAFIASKTNLDVNGKQIDGTVPAKPYKRTSKAPYYIRKDPTVCIAGMASGFPVNFTDPSESRMESQLVLGPSTLDSKVPKDLGALQVLAQKLLSEFMLGPPDATGTPRPGWKLWNDTQPWCPLYVEWEAMYIHLDKDLWNVETFNSGVPVHEMVRYKVDVDLNSDSKYHSDQRIVSGRTLVLPQQIFSLKTMINGIPLTPETIATYNLTPDEVKALSDKIDQMQYISCPLSGFTNHLLTLVEGSHVKPLARTSAQDTPQPLTAAIDATQLITTPVTSPPLFDNGSLPLIGLESALTPYGNLVDFSTGATSPAGFKAVTHGQVLFTKFNIIDKFGQAVCAIDPTPIPVNPQFPPPTVYPCISDYFAPGALSNPIAEGKPAFLPNVVYRDPAPEVRVPAVIPDPSADQPPVPLTTTGQEALSKFFQLNPSINQDARLNTAFVQPDPSGGSGFVSTKDWEQPIWGWVIINYANYGLQFFLPDGTFYTEVRVGGPGGSTENPVRYLPFAKLPAVKGANAQLDSLISSFNADYLQSFFYMINQSVDLTPHAPPDYSNYMTSIVGKPLALVNTRWSLELSTPALEPQQTIGSPLINPDETLDKYQFPIKLGDAYRPFDGLVAYFLIDNSTGLTDFKHMHTYFNDQFPVSSSDPRVPISETAPDGFPKLTPSWVDSTLPFESSNRNFLLTAMLIDPFTPIHAYTPILPITSLTLPSWTVQAACQKMTAFFHLGPMLMTSDVPSKYDEKYQATQIVDPKILAAPVPGAPTVKLPISNKALWRWLQPYDKDGQGVQGTIFDSYALSEDDGKPTFAPGPYTMTEGYLQLLQPVSKPALPA